MSFKRRGWGTLTKLFALGYCFMNLSCNLCKGNVAPVLNKAPHHEAVWGSASIAPHILSLDTRWRWVVSLMFWPPYTWWKSTQYPLDRRVSGPQSQSRWHGEEKTFPTPARNCTPVHQPVAWSLYWLSCCGSLCDLWPFANMLPCIIWYPVLLF
jgi:hypothetical protein